MGKEDLIVDNPLLLTSLFNTGVFFIPEQGNTEKLSVETETKKVEEKAELEQITNEVKNEPLTSESKILIPDTDVIHLVAELGKSPYRTETIPNAMNAIGKLLKTGIPRFEIIDIDELEVPIQEYIQKVPLHVKLIIWSSETPENEEIKKQSERLLSLSMPSVMLSSQERKADHWNRIKSFFLTNVG